MCAITNDFLAVCLRGQSIGSGLPTDIIILMMLFNFGLEKSKLQTATFPLNCNVHSRLIGGISAVNTDDIQDTLRFKEQSQQPRKAVFGRIAK